MTKQDFFATIEARESIKEFNCDKEDCLAEFLNDMKQHGIENHSNIMAFVQEFSLFSFERQECRSKDILTIRLCPCGCVTRHWNQATLPVVQIGEIFNASGNIETLFMSENGRFYNQKKQLLGENADAFLDYLLIAEYDYHAVISNETYRKLRNAGWYVSRKTDISPLVKECLENGIILTEAQIVFLEEFAGIDSTDEPDGIAVCNHREYLWYDKNHPVSNDLSSGFVPISWFVRQKDISMIRIGTYAGGLMDLWLSSEGLLFDDLGAQLGRTPMEGFHWLFSK